MSTNLQNQLIQELSFGLILEVYNLKELNSINRCFRINRRIGAAVTLKIKAIKTRLTKTVSIRERQSHSPWAEHLSACSRFKTLKIPALRYRKRTGRTRGRAAGGLVGVALMPKL